MLTEREQLADELTGLMYKKSDCDDFHTWLPSPFFHSVADKILSHLQSKKLLHPQLQQHDVSGRSEQLPLADVHSFAEWIAKNDEWFWISEDGIWKKDGWRSRTTSELYELFSGNCH